MTGNPIDQLLESIRVCRVCVGQLPHPPRPVLRLSPVARLLVAAGSRAGK